MEQKLFSENWENQLELQFISDDPSRVRAYICSPLKADTSEEYLLNMYAARGTMLAARIQEYFGDAKKRRTYDGYSA